MLKLFGNYLIVLCLLAYNSLVSDMDVGKGKFEEVVDFIKDKLPDEQRNILIEEIEDPGSEAAKIYDAILDLMGSSNELRDRMSGK